MPKAELYIAPVRIRVKTPREAAVAVILKSLSGRTHAECLRILADCTQCIQGTESEGLGHLLSAEGGCVSIIKARAFVPHVQKKIRSGEVIAYQSAGGWVVPTWQFQPKGGLLKGLPEVLKKIRDVLPHTDGLFHFTFFLQADPVTGGRTPLEALRAGDVDLVLTAVDGFRD